MEQNEVLLRQNEQWVQQLQQQERKSLLYELQKYQDFVEPISENVIDELKQRYELSQVKRQNLGR